VGGSVNGIYEIDPVTGEVLRTVATGTGASAIVIDPISGDLFFDYNGQVFRIAHPWTGSNLPWTSYANLDLPAGVTDGMYASPDGTLWVEGDSEISMVSGTNQPQPATATTLGISIPGADGVAAARNSANPGQPPYLMVNSNGGPDGGAVYKVDLAWPASGPPTATVEPDTNVFFGGSRGDFETVGPDGCLYFTQSDSIVKLTNADGSC